MCGIAGLISKSNQSVSNLQTCVTALAQSMNHRGPDDEGIFISPDGCIGLVNRRLAIRDLSAAGHMPMANPEQSIWITYNGELYNADELRPELERLGCTFRSTSDTEVILRGYEVWGERVLNRLEGMFALAIYDLRHANPRVLIARDQMGIKPLYYAQTRDAFVFASELRALFASGLVSREVSPEGLTGYLLFGSVPNPLTIYRGVSALEPATYLDLSLGDKWSCSEPIRYWTLPVDTSDVMSLEEATEQVEGLLSEAVRSQLVSDVPLGAFLSGGLDSSMIVALMRKATSGPIRTCSIAFEESEFSEATYAKTMADAIGAEHYERVVTASDVANEFANILTAMDQPSIDGVNTYFVSKTAREAGLTVALSGLGGDELFGGYPNTFRDLPRVLSALKLAARVPAGKWMARTSIHALQRGQGWNRMTDALRRPPSLASAYMTRRGLFAPSEVKQLVPPDIWHNATTRFDLVEHIQTRANGHSKEHSATSDDAFAWTSRAELRTYTHHQLLRDTDVMSMAHSLEVRVPFFDTRLVEAVLRLPSHLKIGDGQTPKPLLAYIASRHVPNLISQRQDKMGFSFPFDSWLRTTLHNDVQDALSEVKQSGLLQGGYVDQVMSDYHNRKVHWSRLWALVALKAV